MAREKSPERQLLDRVKRDFADHPDLGRVAQKMVKTLPPGREQSLVLTKLEEAMFFANAAIARATPSEAPAPAVSSVGPARKTPAAKKTARRVTRTARN